MKGKWAAKDVTLIFRGPDETERRMKKERTTSHFSASGWCRAYPIQQDAIYELRQQE
jgi:hypothetical protein